MHTKLQSSTILLVALILANNFAMAQGQITSPKEQLGFKIGDDYQLANYTQLVAYWKKLEQESDRMMLEEIGKTAEGRTMWMAIITSPENHKNLGRYKEIASRLALAKSLTDNQARELAREGKAVVWIDGGLHATEVLGAQQLMETVYQLVSKNDAETLRFLRDDILLAVCVNPDGMELVADWYMRESDPTRRSSSGIPRLYHKYVGHDNNRDFYMSTQPETIAINRISYHEWFPQIVYNHHQSGPAGTVLFAPPFRDPFNYVLDPLIPLGIDLVGTAMHSRFIVEGKPGATRRSGASYSTWWNGGLRTAVYFHNMIGLLTEMIGNPTPMRIPFLPQRQLPSGDLPYPIEPQEWHFQQSIDYSVTANRAVLDVASKYREEFLFNIYRMGKNSIDKGNRDTWTTYPKNIAAVEATVARQRQGQQVPGGRGGRSRGVSEQYFRMLREPEKRDPRGYIIPADQPDFPTATKFVNTLYKAGILVHRATRSFEVAGKQYPSESYVVKTAQAFRPFILDMFEPQDHPNDIPYPGGPPTPPYDSAGWTVAYQMGIQFDRILNGFEGPFEKIEGMAKTPAGKVSGTAHAAGFLLSHQVNDSFIGTNRLLASGEEVYWLLDPLEVNGRSYGVGAIFVPSKSGTLSKLQGFASELGLNIDAVDSKPAGDAMKLEPVRIGLWDRYGGSMPSGWIRWLLEQYEFPFKVVYPPTLDAGNLASKFDVLIFVGGAIPAADPGRGSFRRGGSQEPLNIPAEYQSRVGNVTLEKTVPQLRKFVEEGGTLLTIGSSTSMGYHAELPIVNALAEKRSDGSVSRLPREKYYVPGSVLRTRVDNAHPLAYGLEKEVDVYFNNSPVFRLLPNAASAGVHPVIWFDSATPLRSGWAWGQGYLKDGVAVAEASIGKGKLVLFGPEITFRAQPHGTFKLLLNGIYYGKAKVVNLGETSN